MSDPSTHRNEPFDLERESLERPTSFAIDWGGDGSDIERPLRAHVLAALLPSTGPYRSPLDLLLTLGEVDRDTLYQRAAEGGIGQEHVPELVRMVRDRSLGTIDDDDDPAAWASWHALQLLETLDISAVVADLIPLFDTDFERITDQLISVLALAGPAAVEPIVAYIGDRSRWTLGRAQAIDVLPEVVEQHPELREQVVAMLSTMLADAEHDHERVVTAVLSALIDLKATEALPVIRRVFEEQQVDETMNGSWGDVLKQLGVEPEPDDPLIEVSRQRFEERNRAMFPPGLLDNLNRYERQQRAKQQLAEQRAAAHKRKHDKARKQKQKRKAASAARKANRKKR